MRKYQKASIELRFRSFIDLLATYDNDKNPNTKPESDRKAKIVRKTIQPEKTRAMHKNIRTVVEPSPHGGLTKLILPRHNQSTKYPDDYQAFLKKTNAADITWDTVFDKQTIHTNLLRYSRNSFCAAAISPCGQGMIHDKLTFNSLSEEASELVLSGIVPST